MYEQEITRIHRTAFVIAIDQSLSMNDKVFFNGERMSKAVAVAKITDHLINELILRSMRDEQVRNYYDIAIMGYADNEVYPLIEPQRYFIPVSELNSYNPLQTTMIVERILPNGSFYLHTEHQPTWIAPKAYGNTPMYEAMMTIRDLVAEWCRQPQNADSFPPIVFNITDGNSSDCHNEELCSVSEQIKSISTSDGNVLLINVHLASSDEEESIIFPSEKEIDSNNRHMRLLADCSSIMPPQFNEIIRAQRGNLAVPPFRAMSYNASITELLTMLNIGSRSITYLL